MIIELFLKLAIETTEASSYGGFFTIKEKYLTENTNESMSTSGHFRLYETTDFSNGIATKLEVRSEFSSTALDYNDNLSLRNKNQSFDLYFGETYFRYKSASSVFQIGYQELVWGEAFGFNFADIVTPKNLNTTLLSEVDESRRPLPLIQAKFFTNWLTTQLVYGPKAEFSKNYPLGLFFRPVFKTERLELEEDKSSWFKKHEGGVRFSTTLKGMDLSLFAYSYLDRSPYYTIVSYTPNSTVTFKENHSRVNTSGASFSSTLGDFVVRADLVMHKNKQLNFFTQSGIGNKRVNSNELVVSLDTPSYEGYSFFAVAATSRLDQEISGGFRKQNQNIVSLKMSKELTDLGKLEFVLFSELVEKSNGAQFESVWNINDKIDISLGTEFYFGDDSGSASRFKKFNNVFIKFKNYFSF